ELTFAHPGSSGLKINGSNYTLIDDLNTLATDIANDPSGNFALAGSLNENNVSYGGAPIKATFKGVLDGLGHKISNLSINTENKDHVGLFRDIGTSGSVNNLRLTNETVVGGGTGVDVGGFAGISYGTLFEDHVHGAVRAGQQGRVGGLVGHLAKGGTISHSYSAALVADSQTAARIGGIAGEAGAHSSIEFASASGAVNGADGTDVGGLVGFSDNATVSDSRSTGAVSDTSSGNVGGLVGVNGGLIEASYATGSVTAEANAHVGGLVGANHSNIRNTYATGKAKAGSHSDVGGLAGTNNGKIATSYSMGKVHGDANGSVGGFVGDNVSDGGITASYWDTSSSGISKKHGAGNIANKSGITGLTTAELKSGLPEGFVDAVWSENGTINGGLPYLSALKSTY
ncbi:MAG TPA: GLUG motif-containing protein, partial [Lacipirellulaceae bacterium]|nr:GLUG motif-containing protein [Lacipirellulaceae bacterium]